MIEVIKEWEKLGYTNVELTEILYFHLDEIDVEEGSPLYQKIEKVYGCQTENIKLIISEGYGDDKDGNKNILSRLEDEDHLFFVGNQEEYDKVTKLKP